MSRVWAPQHCVHGCGLVGRVAKAARAEDSETHSAVQRLTDEPQAHPHQVLMRAHGTVGKQRVQAHWSTKPPRGRSQYAATHVRMASVMLCSYSQPCGITDLQRSSLATLYSRKSTELRHYLHHASSGRDARQSLDDCPPDDRAGPNPGMTVLGFRASLFRALSFRAWLYGFLGFGALGCRV